MNEEPDDSLQDVQLNGYITRAEILKAMKSNGKSVDNSNFHPTMSKELNLFSQGKKTRTLTPNLVLID